MSNVVWISSERDWPPRRAQRRTGGLAMVEQDFERRLERLFAEAPVLADADAFARRLERRLDRGWTARRALIGVGGVAGGVIAASQLFLSNFAERMEVASQGSAKALSSSLREVAPHADW